MIVRHVVYRHEKKVPDDLVDAKVLYAVESDDSAGAFLSVWYLADAKRVE